MDERYLKLLKGNYPTKQSVYREIINLSAITNLPKGTEFFMSDLHGEYDAFLHILNNCSGVIREKVDLIFAESMSTHEKEELCTLIYYPRRKLSALSEEGLVTESWLEATLGNLIQVAKLLSSKYTRSKVRKALPDDFSYIIDELLHAQPDEDSNQLRYHREIIHSIITLGNAEEFILALTDLIKKLAVDHLHIVGDIYDRGGYANKIMDLLMDFHSIDIEWGNHDILWMGAYAGNDVCIFHVLLNNLRYGNTEILEHAYGISLRDLMIFAMDRYECSQPVEAAKMAVQVILFKLEGRLIQKHPEYRMDSRLLLGQVDPEKMTLTRDGKEYALRGAFPTVEWSDPYALSEEEERIVEKLHFDFTTSEALGKHVRFLLEKGSMYRIYNDNLIYHGCVPLDENGTFDAVELEGKMYHGRNLLDQCERIARRALSKAAREEDIDLMWYLWTGEKSPLCGRLIRTFEHEYFLDEEAKKEPVNPYYKYYYKEATCEMILREFGLYSKSSHIINGHTPVHEIDGEQPIRANGRLFVIDGGFCRPMNSKTGIAGYTLIFNSHRYRLKGHTPFTGVEDVIRKNTDIDDTENLIVPLTKERLLVKDTDTGTEILKEIEELKLLLSEYDRL